MQFPILSNFFRNDYALKFKFRSSYLFVLLTINIHLISIINPPELTSCHSFPVKGKFIFSTIFFIFLNIVQMIKSLQFNVKKQ